MPRWRRDDGSELFYRRADGALVAVPIGEAEQADETGSVSFSHDTPLKLFDSLPGPNGYFRNFSYQPSANGQRFLVSVPTQGEAPITVVLNWQATIAESSELVER